MVQNHFHLLWQLCSHLRFDSSKQKRLQKIVQFFGYAEAGEKKKEIIALNVSNFYSTFTIILSK